LPCGHAFGALNLVFHFCQSKMVCPLCRSGCSSPMDARRLPDHMIDPFLDALIDAASDSDDDDFLVEDSFDSFWLLFLIWRSRLHPAIRITLLVLIASAIAAVLLALLLGALLLDISATITNRLLLPLLFLGAPGVR
jgi:hypothetical protein